MERRLLLAAHVVGSSTVYATIQAAVNAAASGGTVTVDPGTYAEQVTVTKPLTIEGAQTGVDARGSARYNGTASTETIVTGATSGGVNTSAFHVLANDVTLDGFTVEGETSQDDQLGAGIVIGPGQSGTHVTDDVIVDNVSGLFLANASSTDPAVVQHDYFANNNNPGDNGGRGIYTDGTISGGDLTNVTIDSNTFYDNHGSAGTTYLEAALAFEAGNPGEQSNIRITNNSFSDNGKATLFFNTTDVLIQGNTVTGSEDKYSGSLRFEGDNNDVSILYNTIYDNSGPGVAVDSKGSPGDNSGFVVNDDNFYGNNYGYSVPISVACDFDTYDGAFDARDNYWGSSSGPSGYGPGTGDAVGGGAMDLTTGTGWHLSAGGDMLYSPWATATVSVTPTVPAAPSGLTATAASSTQVNLTWTDNAAGNETGFIVQRSADGTNYTQVGTTAAGVTTYTDASGLSAGTKYDYRVYAVNVTVDSAASNVATATTSTSTPTPTPTTTTVVLTTLTPTSETVGWGTLQTNVDIKGTPIRIRGTVYPTGLGAHASSTITYALAGKYATFSSYVGVDDDTDGQGAVDFQVYGDGKLLYDSGVLTGTSPVAHLSVSVAGVQTLTLDALPGVAGTIDYDHADWASPVLTTATTAAKVTARTGTVIGTAGSYQNDGNTIAKAFDGNLSTFYDAASANGDWAGLDLGSAESVSQISFAPRSGFASRMVGGVFQASTSANFTTGVTTLYTITTAPVVGSLTTVTLSTAVTARYFRYLSPTGGYGNVAEIVFAG